MEIRKLGFVERIFGLFSRKSEISEFKRQLEILREECPLVMQYLANASHFNTPIDSLDPIIVHRLEGRRQGFLELVQACQIPKELILEYFEDKQRGERK